MTGRHKSQYAIDDLLPEGERRFLQIRDPFMKLTDNSVIRSGVLECFHFETQRILRNESPVDTKRMFLEVAKSKVAVEDSPLWVRLKAQVVVDRLCGFVSDRRDVRRALDWLEEREFIWTRHTREGKYQYREVLLNLRVLNRAIADLDAYDVADWEEAVEQMPGTPSILTLPDGANYHSLYPALVESIRREFQTDTKSREPARASLVLCKVLWLADQGEKTGDGPSSKWSRENVARYMGFGRREKWMATIDGLSTSRLVLRRYDSERTPSLVPNIPRIMEIISNNSLANAETVDGTMGATRRDNGSNVPGHSEQGPGTSGAGTGDNGASSPELTELFSEPLTDMLREGVSEGIGLVDLSSLPDLNIELRKTQFLQGRGPARHHRLSIADLAAANPKKASRVIELIETMLDPTGRLYGLAIFESPEVSNALAAMILGFLIDTGRTSGSNPLWLSFPHIETVVSQDLNDDDRKALVKHADHATSILVVQGIEQITRKDSVTLVRSAIQARRGKAPVIFTDLTPNLAGLRGLSVNGANELAEEVIGVLRVESETDMINRLFA